MLCVIPLNPNNVFNEIKSKYFIFITDINYRRTEELIGNMYNQYMATNPLSIENGTPKLNGVPRRIDSIKSKTSLIPQISTETNSSDDIKPSISENKEIFTIAKARQNELSTSTAMPNEMTDDKLSTDNVESGVNLPEVLRSRRNILEPIGNISRDVPVWSLAKDPCVVAMQLKKSVVKEEGNDFYLIKNIIK